MARGRGGQEKRKRCPRCGSFPCRCGATHSLPPEQQEARIGRETKGRRGKMVTTVSDLELTNADLEALCTRLKRACGAGGTVKDGVIEVQGDQREKVKRELAGLGYGVKLTGG